MMQKHKLRTSQIFASLFAGIIDYCSEFRLGSQWVFG